MWIYTRSLWEYPVIALLIYKGINVFFLRFFSLRVSPRRTPEARGFVLQLHADYLLVSRWQKQDPNIDSISEAVVFIKEPSWHRDEHRTRLLFNPICHDYQNNAYHKKFIWFPCQPHSDTHFPTHLGSDYKFQITAHVSSVHAHGCMWMRYLRLSEK